ncbi:MAG: Hsp33 family molecular chaperone HslO [Verrucomicrobiota bacterium]
MSLSEEVEGEAEFEGRIAVCSYFVRERNALAVRAEFGPVYMDHYLHLMQHSIQLEPAHDQMLKDALAAITLHLTTKPWHEITAWTMNFQEPLLNLFVTGDSVRENVTGRVFTEDVKESEGGMFVSQVRSRQEETRQSIVRITGDDVFGAVESFWRQSEQRPARFFRYSEEDIVFVSAQPQCDEEWLEGLDERAIRELDDREELSLLETRYYRFDCGCTVERIYPALAPLDGPALDDLFAGEPSVPVTCPRCAASFEVRREGLEAFLAEAEAEAEAEAGEERAG